MRTGPRSFLLLDRQAGKQFELGADERYLLHLLEQGNSAEEIQRAYERRLGKGLSEQHLEAFVEQLRQLDVLEDGKPRTLLPLVPVLATPAPVPLSAGDPGGRLNRCFDCLVVLLGWAVHPLLLVPIAVLTLLAVGTIGHQWDRFWNSLASPRQFFPPWLLWPALALQTLFFLGLPRAVLHGIACRKQGARLREFRLTLYQGLLPHFVCDAGDSLAQLDDQQRRAVVWMGCFWCFLGFGSVYVLLWALARPGSALGTFWLWMTPPCAIALAVNAIPFLGGGAYWLLCLKRHDPRLRERAVAEAKAWLTGRTTAERPEWEEHRWLRNYGLAHGLFHMLFESILIVLLGYFLLTRGKGPGAIAFGAGLLWWYQESLGRVFMAKTGLAWVLRGGGPWPVRYAIRLGLLAGVVAVGFVPYNHEIVGECRVVPGHQHGVRAQLTDEIVQMHVAEGDMVAPGSVVATLSGRSTTENYLAARAELERAEAQRDLKKSGYREEEIRIAEQRYKAAKVRVDFYAEQVKREERLLGNSAASRTEYERYRKDHDAALEESLAAEENLIKLKNGFREEEIRAAEAAVKLQQERLKYCEQMMQLVKVTTPVGGRIVTPYLQQRLGQHVKAGELIAVLQDHARLRIEVAADDAAAENVREGMRVNVRLHGLYGRLLQGRVTRLALTAEQDRMIGLAPVRTDAEAYQEQLLNTNRARTHTAQHLRIDVELDEYPKELRPDMTGYARIVVAEDQVFWQALSRPVLRFFRTEVWSWLP